jgi:hypothetical protein
MLRDFEKLRKATINLVMSVCRFVCLSEWSNRAPTRQIFMKFNISLFSKTGLENLISLKCEKSRHFTGRTIHVFCYISLSFSYSEKLYRRKVLEKVKTHIFCFIFNPAVREIMWKDTVESSRPQMT